MWYSTGVRAGRCTELGGAAFAAAVMLGLACTPAMEPVGYSPHTSTPPPSASAKPPPPPTWVHAKALSSFTRANARRFASSGHYFGKYDADILVNDIARETYGRPSPGTIAKQGSVIVKVHVTREGVAGPVLAMEKGEAGWTYIEMDGGLHVVRKGRLSPCIDCHSHVGSQDELFGVPLTGR
jgi:hypothetical protein